MIEITLKEYRRLQEQAKETRKLGDGNELMWKIDAETEVPTAEAAEAIAILGKAQVTITLDEMRELQKLAKETRKLGDGNGLMWNIDAETEGPTEEAAEAIAILGKAQVTITLDEMKELQKQAKETRKLGDGNELMWNIDTETEEATTEAMMILNGERIIVMVTQDQIGNLPKEMMEKAKIALPEEIEALHQRRKQKTFTTTEIGSATVPNTTTEKRKAAREAESAQEAQKNQDGRGE